MIHIRTPYQPSPAAVPELPQSVAWLNRGTIVLVALLGGVVLVLGLRAVANLPVFAISSLQLRGDTQFHSALTIAANVLPQLSGNYFTVDVRRAQKQFEALPWIRSATVQRRFPSMLEVQLIAHVPVAKWLPLDSGAALDNDLERLVNVQGEVFEASSGQIDTDSLPELSGPAASAASVLALYQQLNTTLNPSTAAQRVWRVERLLLSVQGLWQAVVTTPSDRAVLELGAGDSAAVMARVNRWLAAMPTVVGKYGQRELHSVDLRYTSGFAVSLAGITTHRK